MQHFFEKENDLHLPTSNHLNKRSVDLKDRYLIDICFEYKQTNIYHLAVVR